MKLEHKIIIEAADKEGILPMEKCSRLVVHDLVQATRKQMARYEVGYNKMTEKQQDAVLADLEAAYKDLALVVARTIASAGTPSVLMTLKDMKIAKTCTVTGTVEGNEKFFNELISKAQDKSEVLIVLYERQYEDALDNIQSDKDQKSLPLDGDDKAPKKAKAAPKAKADKKPIEIPEKLIADAKVYVLRNNVATIAALQNGLHIGYEKGEALMARLEADGNVSKPDADGNRTVVRLAPTVETATDGAPEEESDDLTPTGAGAVSFDTVDELTDDLYDKIKAKVIADQSVSAGALSVAFDCEFEVAELAIERLETEGVVGEEDDMGGREVLQAA